MEVPPNQTIYINNLNEKVKKEGECNESVRYMSIILGKTTLRSSEQCVTNADYPCISRVLDNIVHLPVYSLHHTSCSNAVVLDVSSQIMLLK